MLKRKPEEIEKCFGFVLFLSVLSTPGLPTCGRNEFYLKKKNHIVKFLHKDITDTKSKVMAKISCIHTFYQKI